MKGSQWGFIAKELCELISVLIDLLVSGWRRQGDSMGRYLRTLGKDTGVGVVHGSIPSSLALGKSWHPRASVTRSEEWGHNSIAPQEHV